MFIKRRINAFKIVDGRIEYADLIKEAVLNPRIYIKKLHLNGGWDYIDQKYGFIKLLLSRGQVSEIETHSDLLSHADYLNAARLGVKGSYSVSIQFVPKAATKKLAYASEKRVLAAKARWIAFCSGDLKVTECRSDEGGAR